MADEESAGPSVLNFAGAINEKVMESIQNMDVMTVLQKMVAHTPEDEESLDIRERLRGVMDQYNAMTPEEKESFAQQIKRGLASKISAKLRDSPLQMEGLEDAVRSAIVNQLILVGVVGTIILLLIVFFGYKLYKSIKDKEKKKEDKKKLKQQKKKK